MIGNGARGPFWTTVLLACIPLVPTAGVLVIQQVKNNEHQNAAIDANTLAVKELTRRIEAIDAAGTRGFANVAVTQQRAVTTVDRFAERLNIIDQRLASTEATVKALQDDVARLKQPP
jgi:hypothetical protein